MKWEYLKVVVEGGAEDAALAKAGSEGWELVFMQMVLAAASPLATRPPQPGLFMIFKRPLKPKALG